MAKKKSAEDLIDIPAVKEAVRDIVENTVRDVDFKRLTYDSAGKPLVEGISAGIRDNGFMAADAMKTVMKELDLQLQLGAVDNEKYYRYMEEYRNSFFDKGTSGWWEYTLKILEYEGIMRDGQISGIKALSQNIENEKNRIISVYGELMSQAAASVSELERSTAAMKKKLETLYEPYTTQKFRINDDTLILENGVWMHMRDKVYTKTELSNLNEISAQMKLYADLLSEIKNIGGVPADFFRYLRDLPIEDGIELSSLLLKNDAAALGDYVKSWQALKDTEASVTSTLFADDYKALKTEYGSLGDDIVNEIILSLGNLPASFLENGKISAEEFGKGFTNELSRVMTDINRVITQYTTEINLEPQSGGFTASYNFYGSGQTVAQQLAAARLETELNALRN